MDIFSNVYNHFDLIFNTKKSKLLYVSARLPQQAEAVCKTRRQCITEHRAATYSRAPCQMRAHVCVRACVRACVRVCAVLYLFYGSRGTSPDFIIWCRRNLQILRVHVTLMSSCPSEGRTLLWRMLSKATSLRDYQNICWDMQFSRV